MEGRRSTGKLRRPKHPRQATAQSNLRRLQGLGQGRRDPYDALADDPPILERPQTQPQELSPLRKDRKRGPNVREEESNADASSQPLQRRTTRSRLSVPGDEGNEPTAQGTPRRSPRNHDPGEEPSTSTPLTAGSTEKRGRGRPPKRKSSNAQTPGSTEKRGPGRPPKAKPSSAQPSTSTTTKRRGRPSKADSANIELSADEGPMATGTSAVSPSRRSSEQPEESAGGAKKVKPVKVGTSTIDFADDRNNLEDSVVDGQDGADAAQEPSRKRKAAASSQKQGVTPRKRARAVDKPTTAVGTSDGVEEEPESSHQGRHSQQPQQDDTGESTDAHRLFGQGFRLAQVVWALREVGVSYSNGTRTQSNIDCDDQDVRALRLLCNRAKESLTQLRDHGEDEDTTDPPQQFDPIKLRVRRLCGKDKDHPTDHKNKDKAAEIYFHAIPKLVRLLDHTVQVYEAMDGKTSITVKHHKAIVDLIEVILDLGNGALAYDRPDSSLAVIKAVKSDILPPLRAVKDSLSKSLYQREQAPIIARLRAQQEEEEARQEEQEEREREERKREERVRSLWTKLHHERRNVEGMVPRDKSKHLRIPDTTIVEVDGDGESFERVPGFRRRIGPHPAHIARARQHKWKLRQTEALVEGLRSKSGPGVFRDIFREHCVRGGVLNEFNVTEIVTKAADVKEFVQEKQMEDQGFVEEWVRAIPMWTNPHALLGEENAN